MVSVSTPKIMLCLLGIIILFSNQASGVSDQTEWKVDYDNHICMQLQVGERKDLTFKIINLDKAALVKSAAVIRLVSNNTKVVKISKEIPANDIENNSYEGQITLNPTYIGNTYIYVEIDYTRDRRTEYSEKYLYVEVYRRSFHLFNPYISHIINIVVFFILGMVLDSKKLLEILRKPIGPACILFVKFLFATFGVALYLFLFPASGLNQFLFILFFDGITNIVIIRHYFVWAVILKGNMELSSLTNLINIALSIGAGNILLLFLKYSPPEMEVFAELCKDSFFYIFVPLCVGFGVGYLITQHISHLTNIIKFLLEVVFSPILIVVSTCVHLTDGLDLYVYRMFMVKSLLIGFIWPFLIYCASLLITRLMKFEPKDRRSITVEVIIANLLCGKWISSFIIWSSPVGDHELADQLYPAMFGMTFMILTAHCIWIYVEGQQKPSKIQYPRL